jgi:hypothetical protein
MKPETLNTLYKVQDLMKQAREIIDTRMYRSEDSLELPEEDRAYCRKVYDAVCKVMDML